jgi:methyltransferase (TIGR00027 family)
MLAFKERTLDAVDAAPKCRRKTVGVDLREDWAEALLASGFEPAQPTAWLAEGLLCYLGPAEVTQLLLEIDELSAPGSRLAAEYAARRDVDAMIGSVAGTPGMDFLGELWRSALEQDAPAWLAPFGWAAHEHDAQRYAGSLGRSLSDGPAGSGLITARR